jgi:ABC-type antimicrobial peptide transport system permease subunit
MLTTGRRVVTMAIRHARRRPGLAVATLLASTVSAGALTFLVGDATGTSNELLADLNRPDARSILIRATSTDPNKLFDPDATASLASLDGVEAAVGLDAVISATNAAVPGAENNIGFFTITTLDGPAPYRLLTGRQPRAGESIISTAGAATINATSPLTAALTVNGSGHGIVGTYTTTDESRISSLLSTSALTVADDAESYSLISITVREAADLKTVIDSLPIVFSDRVPSDYTTEYDPRLVDVQQAVATAGRQGVKSTALGVSAFGGIITALVTAINALTQRREIARRRALGATRPVTLATLATETIVLAAIGATLGAASVTIVLQHQHGESFPLLAVSSAVFITAIASYAALPGALFGSYQDPAKTLRVP